MPTRLIMALTLALTAHFAHAAPVWKKSGAVSYLCGGVGQEEFSSLNALKSSSNLAVLLTAGDGGSYVSDVLLTLSGAQMPVPIIIGSAGPLCVFRMPPGNYDLQAEYGGAIKSARVSVGSKVTSAQIRFAK